MQSVGRLICQSFNQLCRYAKEENVKNYVVVGLHSDASELD
jgi:hypothetical protein